MPSFDVNLNKQPNWPTNPLPIRFIWFPTEVSWWSIHLNPLGYIYNSLHSQILKQKCCHFDEIFATGYTINFYFDDIFFVTGCILSCHFNSFQCNQSWKRGQNDDISASVMIWASYLISPLKNGRNFSDDIFKCIFFNEKFCISIWISLKFVPEGPIDKSALIQIMAWRWTGDKPLPEPILAQFIKQGEKS